MTFFQKIQTTMQVWRGHVSSDGQRLICNRRHLASDEDAVKRDRLKALERAADDLKIARGIIAGAGKLADYAKVSETTLEN